MDESSMLQNLTLNPSEAAFSFPPYRRRPLRSRTYLALIEILSHCHTNSSQLQIQEVDLGESQPRLVRGENGSMNYNEVNLNATSVPLLISKQSEDILVKETSIANNENKETLNFQDGGSDCNQTTTLELDPINSVVDGGQEVAPADSFKDRDLWVVERHTETYNEVNLNATSVPLPNSKQSDYILVNETSIADCNQATMRELDPINSVIDGGQEVTPANSFSDGDLLVVESQADDCAVQASKAQESSNVIDNEMDYLDILDDLQVDKEFSIDDYSEVLDSCFAMDMVFETSRTVEEDNVPKEAEHELQQKEMELKKLMYSAPIVDSSFCQTVHEEIEEGEISGEAGVADVSFDELHDNAASTGERSTEMVHASEDYFNKEEFMCDDEDGGCRQRQTSDPSLINISKSDFKSVKVKSRTTDVEMGDFRFQNLVRDSHTQTTNIGPIASYSEKQNLTGRNLEENTAATFEKDGDASRNKKRKKGPLTKERRAKRKKKDRIKRAEKNKRLGVKRLKLQPVLKPKTILYCRHYLHGRCHEGENCKFSHDTVPLTKSKPCGHFARHSCMKGDDCPYDHQLSKYPCKNYTENGFCGRGSDCLFSHEMPDKLYLSMNPTASKPELTSAQHTVPDKCGSSSKVSKPEVNFSSPPNISKYSKHTDSNGTFHQKVDSKLSSAGNPNGKNTELCPARTVGRAPKGISFLSNKQPSSGDTCQHEKIGSTKDVRLKPRGVNFLSFARPISDDSSRKTFSEFLSTSNVETRTIVDESGEGGKRINSLPENVGILGVSTQMNQNAKNLVTDINENVSGTLWSQGGQSETSHLSFKSLFLSNTPSSVQKAVKSTLAFAAKFESDIKIGSSFHQPGS